MGVVARIKENLSRRTRQHEKSFYREVRKKYSQGADLLSIGDFIRRAFWSHPNETALICGKDSISYKELYYRAVLVAKLLDKNNVKFRDKVLLYCENSVEFYIFYYAIWLRGAVAIPLNIFLHEKELAHIINDSKPVAILTLEKLKSKLDDLVTQDNPVQDNPVQDNPVIFTEKDINCERVVPKSVRSIRDPFKNDKLDLDEMCLLLYTSGTTGVSKGVMLSSRNILTNAMQDYARQRLFTAEKERFIAVLPLFHVFAQNTCMWLPLMTGSSVIIVPRIERRLILEGLQKKPTLFFGFPALYGLLCLMKNAPLDSVKRFVSGADAMPDKIRAAFAMIYGRKICAGYGLTEASPVIAINHDQENLETSVVGQPVVELECEIRDEEGLSLARGETGTLWVRGDNVMLGYYKAPDATKKVLKKGWLNTGDLASIDVAGNLTIRGRSKDLIIHKGFNIYPQEVENVLMTHPNVFKAAVIGKEEAVVGQVPIAYVAARGDKDYVEKSLRDLCKNNLAIYKVPRRFICLDDLPMSSTGKVDKKQLQQ
jgi:long-chain acyl-CoA synthetase